MAVLTNCDYWASADDPPTNCGGRWTLAEPGDVLLAHDDPSARRVARLRGCRLVEVTTLADGSQVVSGPAGAFPLRGSYPPLPVADADPACECDVAVFGPPDDALLRNLEGLDEKGRSVRVYDGRWETPLRVGGVSGGSLLAALRGAALVVAKSEDVRAVAQALGTPTAPYDLGADDEFADRATRYREVLECAG